MLPLHQAGDPRLRLAEETRRLFGRPASIPDDLLEIEHQVGTDLEVHRLLGAEAQILEDVVAATHNFDLLLVIHGSGLLWPSR